MKALALKTDKLFDKVCSLNCIKSYTLVGGTALAIQLENRQSEDLDFMSWKSNKKQKQEFDWVSIEKELKEIGRIESREIFDLEHVEFVVSGVKISFYASNKFSPVEIPVHVKCYIYLADIHAIGAMKMEVLMRRSNFKDYYDIYSILKTGINIKSIVQLATKYSGNLLSTKNLLAMLVDSKRFHIDSGFQLLQPIYDITPIQIEEYLKVLIKQHFHDDKK